MVSRQVHILRDGIEKGWNTTCIPQNDSFLKLDGPNIWLDICIIIGIFGLCSHISPSYEFYIIKTASTRNTISKGRYGIDIETMDATGPKVTGKAREGHQGRTYFSNNRPTPKVLYQDRLVQGCNGSGSFKSGGIS